MVLAACREAAQWDALPGVLATLAAACSRDAAAAPPLLRSERVHAELIAAFGRLGEPHRSVALLRQLLASNLPLTQRPFDATLAAITSNSAERQGNGQVVTLVERGGPGDFDRLREAGVSPISPLSRRPSAEGAQPDAG